MYYSLLAVVTTLFYLRFSKTQRFPPVQFAGVNAVAHAGAVAVLCAVDRGGGDDGVGVGAVDGGGAGGAPGARQGERREAQLVGVQIGLVAGVGEVLFGPEIIFT